MNVHQLFEAQAKRTPNAEALRFGGERLSYRELDRRSDEVAGYLLRRGVAAESLVGIAVERSIEMVVGLLGILKAGGAYVPLDPEYPHERLSFMWRDSQRERRPGFKPVLLTLERVASTLPADLVSADVELVRLDADRPAMASEHGPFDRPPADGDQLAYVIYTSGSTGMPKGVVIAHRGVVNLIHEAVRLLRIDGESRLLQLATLSFDASVLEIFSALSSGACLVLTPQQTLLSGATLGEELRRHRITTLAIPPSLLDKVPEGDGTFEYPDLRAIVVGGEACSAATAERWAPGRNFLNAYAPTEATIFTTAMPCRPPFDRPPAMGWAIPNTEVHVYDPHGQPVADGRIGELYLGGVGVARGYLYRAGLTAWHFVPDPNTYGGRLYRSGDLARRKEDGTVEFVSRADTQVKVRGLRIELGEIESVLSQHPEVTAAVATVRRDSDDGGDRGDDRLVVYAVPRRPDARPTSSELRSYLGQRLPSSMVPAAFVFLDAFPMTPTGKVDRSALPAPGRQRPELATAYVAPQGPWQEALAAIWKDLLALDEVGVHDSLFELGGHSLLAAQITSRVRDELGRELRLTEVFERPTVAELAEVLVSPQTALFGAQPPPIGKASRDRPIPLSFPQERVWFLLQLAPDSVAYNFQFSIRFRGELDPKVLERSLGELVRRHEVLRTTFPAVDGRPVQVIHPELRVELPVEDLSLAPAADRESIAERRVREEMARPFDITELPLLRWLLLRLGENDHLLLQVEHHFVHDGWSLAVYLRELRELYVAFRADPEAPSPLPEPAVQYADFAVWQRSWMQGEALAHQLAYWKDRLAGGPPLLELPSDRPRPRAHSFRGGCLRVDLPPELYAALREFSRLQGVTLFMTMLAVFDTLMYRTTGQRDFLLGSGLANRRLRELEALVGMVVNTLVLRASVSGAMSFRELLDQVRRTTLEVHDYQDLPFEKLVEELQPDRDLSRNPLFQVLFSFHDAPVPDLELRGLQGELFEWHNGSAKAELNVVVKPVAEQRVGRRPSGGEQLTMVWEYSSDIFDCATIERMWGHYQTLLAGVVEGVSQRLRELPMLTPGERRQLAAWNAAAALDTAPAGKVHELVAVQAARTPDALAVADAASSLSYRELDARADDLAHTLRRLGTGPEAVVAIATGRCSEMAVAALAVLKAGGAYLPLDPAYPKDRLAFMIEDSGAAALLIRGALRERMPAAEVPVLAVDAPPAAARPFSLPPAGGVADLAYVIYTSGSTGLPKGVELSHRGLATLVAWHQRYHQLGAADRSTVLAGPAFDASVWELWPYLAAGASLHVPDAETRSSAELLLDWLARERISRSFLATPLAEAVLEAASGLDAAARPAALRTVLTGGDRLDRAPDPALGFELVNHYGPTENTVVATAGAVDPERAGSGPPPIGVPISGTRVYVVDRDFVRLPAGVPGELLIAGAGLARGYRRRPALTAALFVPDPWAERPGRGPGERLYRSGDLVRFLGSGEIEFLGRIDSQVKIRGFRVELGEVSARLGEHPAVRDAEVLARPVAGALALVAYVVPAAGVPAAGVPAGEFDPAALRPFLEERLPDYMVPAIYVPLAVLPLTPNGKVDRRALPDPDLAELGDGRGPASPRTPLEELLTAIWAQILEREEIGIHDNFFELGGHSLLATQVLARLRDASGVEVPLAEFFEGPSVAALARTVDRRLGGVAAVAGELIPRRAAGEVPPLAFAQERLWFLEQLAPGNSAYNIARAYRLAGRLDEAALGSALAEVARRHEALCTTFRSIDGRPVQLVSEETAPRLGVVDLRRLPARQRRDEIERRRRAGAAQPFRLDREALLRLTLLRLAPDEGVLLLSMHHIVSDGWSMGILLGELSVSYAAFAAGEAPRWAALPIQYGDFAAWQRRRGAGEALAAEVTFWRQQLRGAPGVLELPTDRPRPKVQGLRGDQVEIGLSSALVARLRKLCGTAGVTPFMALLSAFTVLLHRYSGQNDVVVGTPIAGRGRSEVEGLIGFFVNTLALPLDLRGNPGYRQLVQRVRSAVLGAHAHQEVPFEKLLDELAPERSLSHSPLFQVLFTLETLPSAELELAGLEVEALQVERRESRFDLEMSVRATPGDHAGMTAVLRYDTDLFDRSTAGRMAACFRHLLDAALADPDRPIGQLALMAADEQRRMVEEWSSPAAPEPAAEEPSRCLHEAFALQAERTPEASALVCGGARFSYRELERRANRLGHYLRELGVGPESAVAVLLERSPEMVVALLAVLKAGGCYVPLDPGYPRRRSELILGDTRAPVVVTQGALAGGLSPHGFRVVLLDGSQDRPRIDLQSDAAPGASSGIGNLAYVIYTSGSTGRPKGVAIEHRTAAAMVRWAHTVYSAEQLRSVLAATSICFDLSVFELFVPLTAGGRVVLVRDALSLPRHDGVTLVNTVPSAIAELVRLDGLPRSVRTVNLAGEPLKPPLVDALYERVDDVFDLYGPSEDTTYSTFVRRAAGGPETIGRPIAGTRAYLLDQRGEPVPETVPGEIYLGGAGVSRGYLRRPASTAERYFPDPFSQRPGARYFRTGDRARRFGDGSLAFLGRLDHQVKVRGFRIELGEIESVLLGHPGVRETVVLARRDGNPGDRRLVAYVTAGEGVAAPGAEDLAAHLGERLPGYMVPSAFLMLSELPRTPNGKLDRAALPAPAEPQRDAAAFVAPRDELEARMAKIWAEVLGVEKVGVEDSFFKLGGHSLLATQVIARTRHELDVELALRTLFEAPTVATLVARIKSQSEDATKPRVTRIGRAKRVARRRPGKG